MEREERFVTLVQTTLLYFAIHGRIIHGGAREIPELYDVTHCLDDAYFYARNQSKEIMTKNLASLAQYFVARWFRGDPECKHACAHNERPTSDY
jgi:hypothetical protein